MKTFPIIYRGPASRSKIPSLQMLLRFAAASSVALVFESCQTFEKKPLNLSAHHERWQAQSPSSEKVQAFAKRIAKASPDTSPFNPSNGISLNEGKLIALVFNPDLRVARLKAGVTKAASDYAGLWDDPQLGLNLFKATKSVPDPWIVTGSLAVTLPLSGRLTAEKKLAKASMLAELDRVAETEWQLVNNLQKSWLEWSAHRSELEQTKVFLEVLPSIVKSTLLLAEQGEIPKTEANLFTIEQKSRQVELKRLEGEVQATEQQIRSLLGLTPNAPLHLIPNLTAATWKPSLDRLRYNNPTINRLRRDYEVSERTLIREVRKQYPDLVFGPQAEKEDGQSRIGFIGGIPLPILNANKGGIAKARAQREVAQATFETEYQRKVAQLAAKEARLRSIRAQQSAMQNEVIPLVDRQAGDAQKIVELGEGGSLVLLESLVRAHEAKLQVINIQYQHSQMESDIQFLLGPTNHKSNPKKD